MGWSGPAYELHAGPTLPESQRALRLHEKHSTAEQVDVIRKSACWRNVQLLQHHAFVTPDNYAACCVKVNCARCGLIVEQIRAKQQNCIVFLARNPDPCLSDQLISTHSSSLGLRASRRGGTTSSQPPPEEPLVVGPLPELLLTPHLPDEVLCAVQLLTEPVCG